MRKYVAHTNGIFRAAYTEQLRHLHVPLRQFLKTRFMGLKQIEAWGSCPMHCYLLVCLLSLHRDMDTNQRRAFTPGQCSSGVRRRMGVHVQHGTLCEAAKGLVGRLHRKIGPRLHRGRWEGRVKTQVRSMCFIYYQCNPSLMALLHACNAN